MKWFPVLFLSLLGILWLPVSGQVVFNQNIKAKTNQVKGLSTDLRTLESFGIKNGSSQGLSNTVNWLESRYQEMGYTQISRDSFNNPVYTLSNVNLIVDKPGTDTTLPMVILCSHYDTRNGPGVNDNGTGVAAMLAIAEIIADIDTRSSVRFIHFAGEEDGLLGSTHYVDDVLGNNAPVRILINLDQLGGTMGQTNDKITCERDETFPDFNNATSWVHTDTMAQLIELYTSLQTVIDQAFSSDYMPFQAKGYVITGLWQFDGFQYPFYHSSRDSLIHVDTVSTLEVTRGALAAVLHFSQTPEFLSADAPKIAHVAVYPNPSSGNLFVDLPSEETYILEFWDYCGRKVANVEVYIPGEMLHLNLPAGMYTLKASGLSTGTRFTGKFVNLK